jgi:hypothetical protein
MSYSLLALDPNSQHMSLPVLRALHKLVSEGAQPSPDPSPPTSRAWPTTRPSSTNSPTNSSATAQASTASAKAASSPAKPSPKSCPSSTSPPTSPTRSPESDTKLLFVHRRLPEADIYFVDNRSDRAETLDTTFRITGYAPEIWHAETGLVEPASYAIESGHTIVPLTLEPWGAVFVVFRKPAAAPSFTARSHRNHPDHSRWLLDRRLPVGARRAPIRHARS